MLGESLSTHKNIQQKHTYRHSSRYHTPCPTGLTDGAASLSIPLSLSCCLLWAVSLSPANCQSGSNTKSAAETVPNRVLYSE